MAFEISRANAIPFRIETGPGTSNVGNETIPENYLIDDASSYYNDERIQIDDKVLQFLYPKYNRDDTPVLQVETDANDPPPFVKYVDGNNVNWTQMTLLSAAKGTHKLDLDFSSYTMPSHLIQLEVYGFSTGPQLWLCGDNGDFETTSTGWNVLTGANNIVARSNAVMAVNGLYEAVIGSGAAPAAGDDLIITCNTSFGLISGEWYEVKGYVQDSSVTPFVAGNSKIYWDLSDFTDATVHIQTRPTMSIDGRDVWHEVSAVFEVGTDTGGLIGLRVENLPAANGSIYVDFVHVKQLSGFVKEATSEKILIKSNHPNTQKVEWTSSVDGFNIDYESQSFTNMMRVDLVCRKWEPDVDNEVTQNTYNQNVVNHSYIRKNYTLESPILSARCLEILTIASNHPTFKIGGIPFIPEDGGIQPDWDSNGVMGNVSGSVRLKNYDYSYNIS